MGPIGSGIGFPYTDIAEARIIVYGNPMRILWDEPKRLANLRNRGLDFASLDLEFFASSVVVPAKLGRHKAIGLFDDVPTTVIFRSLGTEAISVVSMRWASRKERSLLWDD